MNANEMELIFNERQSCRNYSSRQVDKQILDKIADMARLSPSACNSQPWKIICVSGEKAKDFSDCVTDMGANKFTRNCPSFFVILRDKATLSERAGERFTHSAFIDNDIGILAAHICFAAHSFGLGTCILGWRNENKLRSFLSLEKDRRIPLIVACGYPDESDVIRPKKRKSLEDIYTYIE